MFDGLKDKLDSFTRDAADETSEDPSDEAPADTDTADKSDSDADSSVTLSRKAKSLAKGQTVIDDETLNGPLTDLQMALLESGVEYDVVETILDGIREELVGETKRIGSGATDMVEDALREALLDVLSVNQFDFDAHINDADKPVTIVFTGVNGVGKTTSIAKLAQYFDERGFSCVLANGDTYRAGAEEQIRAHADALDVPLMTHERGSDPAAVIYDAVEYATANDVDVVLGDTSGRLHTDEGLMAQLEKIDRVVAPDMTLFVDEAVAGQDAVNRAREFADATGIDGAILTMAEADDSGGAPISVAHAAGVPILFLGTGQEYDDLIRFDPEDVVDRLLDDA